MYDISCLYDNISTQVIHTTTKCFKNENDDSFFLILDNEDQVNKFNSQFLLTMLKYIKTQSASNFVICVRKDISKNLKRKMDRSLRFIGFRKMNKASQQVISITETHVLYNMNCDTE